MNRYVILNNNMAKRNPKILVVDDEKDVCQFVQSYFGRRNIDVLTTGSGLKAIDLVSSFKPDIILLDHILEDITGLESLKKIREFDKDVKVVLITGCEFSEEREKEIRESGITEYLHKPLVLEQLAEVVYSILEHKPLPAVTKIPKITTEKDKDSKGSISHKLSNLIGIIRNKCEIFVWNLDDNIYKDKTEKELLEMSVEIMKDVIKTADRTTEVIDKIKKTEAE